MPAMPDSPGDQVPVHEEYRDPDQQNYKCDNSCSCHLSLGSGDERRLRRSFSPPLHTSCEKARYWDVEFHTFSNRLGSQGMSMLLPDVE